MKKDEARPDPDQINKPDTLSKPDRVKRYSGDQGVYFEPNEELNENPFSPPTPPKEKDKEENKS